MKCWTSLWNSSSPPWGCGIPCGECSRSQATARRNILCQQDAKRKSGNEGDGEAILQDAFPALFGLEASLLVSQQTAFGSLGNCAQSILVQSWSWGCLQWPVPGSSAAYRKEGLVLKKKKINQPKPPPLELGSEETWILLQALCSFWVALDMSHCWLFSSAWKSRMKHGRGVSLPAPPDRRSAAHQELLAQALMDEMGFVALLQLPATASAPVSLHCPRMEVLRGWNNLPGCSWEAATQASYFLRAGLRAAVCTKGRSLAWHNGTKTEDFCVHIWIFQYLLWQFAGMLHYLDCSHTDKITGDLTEVKAQGKLILVVASGWKLVSQKWQLEASVKESGS